MMMIASVGARLREVHFTEDLKLICNNNDNEVLVKLRKQAERTRVCRWRDKVTAKFSHVTGICRTATKAQKLARKRNLFHQLILIDPMKIRLEP